MTEEQNLCVPVGKTWRIVASEASYILQRKRGKLWASFYYSGDLCRIIDHAFNVRVRTAGAQNVEDLAKRIEDIRSEFRRDLAPLLTAPHVVLSGDEV